MLCIIACIHTLIKVIKRNCVPSVPYYYCIYCNNIVFSHFLGGEIPELPTAFLVSNPTLNQLISYVLHTLPIPSSLIASTFIILSLFSQYSLFLFVIITHTHTYIYIYIFLFYFFCCEKFIDLVLVSAPI